MHTYITLDKIKVEIPAVITSACIFKIKLRRMVNPMTIKLLWDNMI